MPGIISTSTSTFGADAKRLSEDRALLGRLLETFVVGELRKQISWTDRQTTLYHFRTATGSEADVILEKTDDTVAAMRSKPAPRWLRQTSPRSKHSGIKSGSDSAPGL